MKQERVRTIMFNATPETVHRKVKYLLPPFDDECAVSVGIRKGDVIRFQRPRPIPEFKACKMIGEVICLRSAEVADEDGIKTIIVAQVACLCWWPSRWIWPKKDFLRDEKGVLCGDAGNPYIFTPEMITKLRFRSFWFHFPQRIADLLAWIF